MVTRYYLQILFTLKQRGRRHGARGDHRKLNAHLPRFVADRGYTDALQAQVHLFAKREKKHTVNLKHPNIP